MYFADQNMIEETETESRISMFECLSSRLLAFA